MKKNFTLLRLVMLCLLFSAFANAQSPLKGTVTDASTGETLPGVTVAVQGTATGTQTGADGAFTINAASGSTLIFTYIGYTRQVVVISDQTNLSIKLQPEQKELQQVVVIGYGTQRKRDVTGAIGNVSGNEVAKQPVQTPTQALQGKVAGIQIIGSGQPNSQPQIRIRGTGSILGGVNPLYVVDGILTDDIRNINNNDILSIDVLKDASAAIYGVRGANGVIIITTKKGKKGPPVVSYDANAGFREISNTVKLADRSQYIAYQRDNNAASLSADAAPLTIPGTTNWYDAVLRKGFETSHNVSVSGGGDNNTYFISANYLVDNGIIKTNNFQRFSLRANNDVNISKKLRFTEQLSLSRGSERPVDASILSNVYRAAPIISSIDGSGKYGNTSAWGNVGNPLLQLNKVNNFTGSNRVQGNVALEYKPVSFLTLRSAFNADVIFDKQRNYAYQFDADANTFTVGGGNQRQPNSSLFAQQDELYHYTWDNTITFDKRFDKHHFTVLGGYVTEEQRSSFINGSRINVPADPNEWFFSLGNPDLNSTSNNGGDLIRRVSYVARLNYDYNGKYLLSASYRRDGSSRFAEKYGNFYTVGAGWVISEESFLKDQDVLNYLKLRGSFGALGNDNISTSQYINTATINLPYYFNNGQLGLSTAFTDIKDTGLHWETTKQYDLGFEYAFLHNRLTGEVDYYHKQVNNALTTILIPAIFGDTDGSYVTNGASFLNKGFEFGIKWSDKITNKLSYNIGGNITYNKNTVNNLNGGTPLLGDAINGQSVTVTNTGHPIASYYVLQATGVFQTQAEVNAAPANTFEANHVGGLKYADINGDGKIDANDRVYAGSYQPKFYGGFNVGLTYTNFDLSADFYYNWGNKIYNGKKNARADLRDNVEAAYADNRWTTGNPSATNPNVITSSTPPSTYFIESGAFLRLNNLTLGYTVPTELLKRANISRLRFYFTSQNLFTAKRYSGFTPELLNSNVLSQGIEQAIYPTTRTFAFGVNLSF